MVDNHISSAPRRHSGFDLLRVLATYMVMQIHTGEFEYISANGTVLHSTGAWAAGWMNSLLRVCVPLFVMISGFFLFPIKDEKEFFRKRFTRVLIPFVLWCAIYAFYYYAQGLASFSVTLLNIAKIPVNYGTEVGHLWFLYMLMGIYLIASRKAHVIWMYCETSSILRRSLRSAKTPPNRENNMIGNWPRNKSRPR